MPDRDPEDICPWPAAWSTSQDSCPPRAVVKSVEDLTAVVTGAEERSACSHHTPAGRDPRPPPWRAGPSCSRDHPSPIPDHHAQSRSVLWARSAPACPPAPLGPGLPSGFIPEKPDPSSNDSLQTPEGTLDMPSQHIQLFLSDHFQNLLVITLRHHLTYQCSS